ncbi:MAG: leishmanolysin-related zinc metalloendopeptidase [Microthrixaceae bacterium]
MKLRNLAVPVSVFLLAAGCGCSTAPPPKPRSFNITLRITGSPNATATQAVRDGERKLESIITTDLSDIPRSAGLQCDPRDPNPPTTIDDLYIDVKFVNDDGPGGTLASAGPCVTRTSNGLPVTGTVLIDRADVPGMIQSGSLDETVLHEMTHVVGFGTLWSRKGLVQGAGGSNPRFSGSKANIAWRGLGGTGSVPVENSGGGGTRDGHWRESVLNNELMTGYANSGFNPMSTISVASLGDLGYTVDMAKADRFTVPRARTADDALATEAGHPFEEELFGPTRTVEG